MATTDHGASCRCANCRAKRAVAQPPQPGRPSDPLSLPLGNVNELPDDVRQTIQSDPVGTVLASMEDDADPRGIVRYLSLAGFDDAEAKAIVQQAEDFYVAGRRKRGFRRILTGIAIAVFAIFAVETVQWLIWGEFGSFGSLTGYLCWWGCTTWCGGYTMWRPARGRRGTVLVAIPLPSNWWLQAKARRRSPGLSL